MAKSQGFYSCVWILFLLFIFILIIGIKPFAVSITMTFKLHLPYLKTLLLNIFYS